MIELEQISFRYGPKTVLSGIDLVIGEGEFVCVLGESGCGKSTLLRLIAGLLFPALDGGTVRIGGDKVTGTGPERAVVFQDYSLFPWLTTGENLLLALQAAYRDRSRRALREIALEYLALVGLPDVFHLYPAALSGGMRQRAAIARALAVNPPILLMDEPFGALDPLNRTALQELLLELWQRSSRKRTVVFVTHDIEEALLLGSRVLVLGSSPGRIIADLAVDFPRPRRRTELYEDPTYREMFAAITAGYHRDVLARRESVFPDGGGI